MKELELPWLKKVSWASHFGNIFMKSSVMADILNKSNFYFTFSYNLRILWLLFYLHLINWIGSFSSLKPDHSISPFPHENNLRVKKQFGNSVAIFKITRLLTFWIAVDGVVSDVSGQVIFQGLFLPLSFGNTVKC